MTPEAAVQEFVAGLLRLTLADLLRGAELDIAAYGDVEAAVRQQFENASTDFEALAQAVTATVPRNQRDAVGAALALLQQAYARQLRAKQQTAFLIGLEIGRATPPSSGALKSRHHTEINEIASSSGKPHDFLSGFGRKPRSCL